MRIAVVAPSNTLSPLVPPAMAGLIADRYADRAPEIVFHPQCFQRAGHFAGPDGDRVDALVEVANDPAIDAVWCARGGYGANRVAQRALERMGPHARAKPFLGYSDAGFLLAGCLRWHIGRPVHAPMPSEVLRAGGEVAVARSLDWLIADQALECGAVRPPPRQAAAFNMTVFHSLLGTPLEPDLGGRVLMLEEVGEAHYRIDRMLFAITSNQCVARADGLMLGRCDPVPPNDPAFGDDEVQIARHWCTAAGIAWLGRADIGHDNANIVVEFG